MVVFDERSKIQWYLAFAWLQLQPVSACVDCFRAKFVLVFIHYLRFRTCILLNFATLRIHWLWSWSYCQNIKKRVTQIVLWYNSCYQTWWGCNALWYHSRDFLQFGSFLGGGPSLLILHLSVRFPYQPQREMTSRTTDLSCLISGSTGRRLVLELSGSNPSLGILDFNFLIFICTEISFSNNNTLKCDFLFLFLHFPYEKKSLQKGNCILNVHLFFTLMLKIHLKLILNTW